MHNMMLCLPAFTVYWSACWTAVSSQCSCMSYCITNSRKYERGLTYTRRHELHWLDISERIQFRIVVTVHRCLNGLAPAYLTELCTSVTQNRSSCHLRSSYCHRLAVPSVKLSIVSRSFSVSGPTVWNALPDYFRNSTLPIDVFKSYLKTFIINTTL